MILRTQEDFRSYEERNGFLPNNHIHIDSVSPERSAVSVRIVPESRNAAGFVHGGLLMLLADVAASQTAMADGRQYVTQNTFVSFLSSVREGTLTAEGETVRRGGEKDRSDPGAGLRRDAEAAGGCLGHDDVYGLRAARSGGWKRPAFPMSVFIISPMEVFHAAWYSKDSDHPNEERRVSLWIRTQPWISTGKRASSAIWTA